MIFSHKFDFIDVLLLFAIVAGEDAVSHMEVGSHGLVVGDALWIVALNDATNLIRCHYVALLNHLVVADDAKNNIWSYY